MENRTNYFFVNPIFDNQNLNNRYKKEFLALTNELYHKKHKINLISNAIKSRYQYNPNLIRNEIDSDNKKNKGRGKEFNILSCPNKKNLKELGNKHTFINSIQSKLFSIREIGIKPIKNKKINISAFHNIDENNKLNCCLKDNKSSKFINNLRGNQTLYAPFFVNKNNSFKNSNIINDCVKIRQVNPENTEGNDKKESIDKMRLTNTNSWFRKSTFQNTKLKSLPKMKNLNEREEEKEKEKDDNEKIKTFLQINKRSIKQISSLFKKKNLHKIKKKNLVISYEIYSLPGTEKGNQKINQDTYLVFPNVNNTHNAKIFGIFDGHGKYGDKLSQEIRDNFIDFFSDKNKYEKEIFKDYEQRLSNDDNLEKIYKYMTKNNYREINQFFKEINSKLHDKYLSNNICFNSGTTSNILMILNDKNTQTLNKIISINLGDSKCILINKENKIFELNERHTPDNIKEKERIEQNGGEISRVDWADFGPLRIFYKNKPYPGLSMTRAFGDFNAENLGFNTIPDIVEYDINEKKPKIIILATDGIWQFLSNEQVKNIILPYYDEDNINGGIQKLVGSARKMWETKNPRFIDDITIILIFFR